MTTQPHPASHIGPVLVYFAVAAALGLTAIYFALKAVVWVTEPLRSL